MQGDRSRANARGRLCLGCAIGAVGVEVAHPCSAFCFTRARPRASRCVMLTKRAALALPIGLALTLAMPRPSRSQSAATKPVATGADVLAASGFADLAGKRVGLITNQTGLV